MKVRLGDFIQEYSVRNRAEEDIPVYSVTNTEGFCTGYFDKDVASNDRSTYKIVPRGCFAYNPSRINVGSVDWQRHEDRVIVSPLYVVFSVSNGLLPQYLYYFLKSNVALTFIRATATGSVRDNLRFSMLQEFSIEMRSIEGQTKVIQTLDSIQKLIKLYKLQLRTLDTLIKARFVELFGDPEYNEKGWPIKKLNELCSVGSSKRIYQEEQTMEGVPFWRISDLVTKMDTGNVESNLFIPKNRYEELKAQGLVPEPGDILVTSRGTLGRCYIVAPDDRFYFQDGMISWFSKYEDVTPLYIQFLFSMPGFRKQIDCMQAGSTVAYLSIAMLKKLDIMLPGRDVLEQFAAFVSQVDKSKAVVQAALDKAQLLFDSLMQQYFG